METLIIAQGIAIICLIAWCIWLHGKIAELTFVIVAMIEKLGWYEDVTDEEK